MRDAIRAWTESTETFVLDVILGGRKGKRAALLRSILFGLSRIYAAAVKARRFLFNGPDLRDK